MNAQAIINIQLAIEIMDVHAGNRHRAVNAVPVDIQYFRIEGMNLQPTKQRLLFGGNIAAGSPKVISGYDRLLMGTGSGKNEKGVRNYDEAGTAWGGA